MGSRISRVATPFSDRRDWPILRTTRDARIVTAIRSVLTDSLLQPPPLSSVPPPTSENSVPSVKVVCIPLGLCKTTRMMSARRLVRSPDRSSRRLQHAVPLTQQPDLGSGAYSEQEKHAEPLEQRSESDARPQGKRRCRARCRGFHHYSRGFIGVDGCDGIWHVHGQRGHPDFEPRHPVECHESSAWILYRECERKSSRQHLCVCGAGTSDQP